MNREKIKTQNQAKKSKPKHIFLDFDGVMHGGERGDLPFFHHMEMFSNFLREHLLLGIKIRIVISSAWRGEYTLVEIRKFFPEDIASLIVGVTPIHQDALEPGGRIKEIQRWCQINRVSSNDWRAIDDMQFLFTDNCPNLILCNHSCGMTQVQLQELSNFLTKKDA